MLKVKEMCTLDKIKINSLICAKSYAGPTNNYVILQKSLMRMLCVHGINLHCT